ncbi:phosphatidylinositol mannoside acyltransferase, partial [Mycobacterium avium subsp. hominissuis]|nr:phosphatidylinositol mannoside acyltransferase [Mycobacterium avium subsp. hominissuis]
MRAITAPGRLAGRLVGGVGADWAYATGWMAVRAANSGIARTAIPPV